MRWRAQKPRDQDQAQAVAKLVQDARPHPPFESALTSLHGGVHKMLSALIR